MKEENSVRGGVSGISLKGSLSRGGASRKTATGYELGQSVAKKKKRCIQTRPEMVQAMAVNPFKGPGRGARARYGYNQGKNQCSNPKFPKCFAKSLKNKSR